MLSMRNLLVLLLVVALLSRYMTPGSLTKNQMVYLGGTLLVGWALMNRREGMCNIVSNPSLFTFTAAGGRPYVYTGLHKAPACDAKRN